MTSKREKSLDHTLELRIPFETERQATIATKVLSPDPILKPQDFQVDYSSEKNVMLVQFRSIDDRVLRVGVSSIIDSIKTIVEAMERSIINN
ncbi:CBM_collapsed_G0036800.mRNA.1.CDS.1 [Saccharomyces cerevisiae]|nr:CBM_collapsed_G0036800.mRNA.1.CDS.1 [Saccharomyces cerevisiae]